MNIGLLLSVIFFSIVIISIVIYVVFYFSKDKRKIKDSPILINFMSKKTHGYSIGTQISMKEVDGRVLFEFEPKDISAEDIEKGIKINNEKVIIDKNKIVTLSNGDLSDRETIKILLPPNGDNLPKNLQETNFGKLLINYIENINTENQVIETLKNRVISEDKLLNRTEGGERISEYIELDKEINEGIAKKVGETSNKQYSGSNSFPNRGNL